MRRWWLGSDLTALRSLLHTAVGFGLVEDDDDAREPVLFIGVGQRSIGHESERAHVEFGQNEVALASTLTFDQGEEALGELVQGLGSALKLGAQDRALPADPEEDGEACAVGIGAKLPGALRGLEAAGGARLPIGKDGGQAVAK